MDLGLRQIPQPIRRANDFDVSKLVAQREGFDLLPEMGFKPTNKYLPPRAKRDAAATAAAPKPVVAAIKPKSTEAGSVSAKFFAWADRVLSN